MADCSTSAVSSLVQSSRSEIASTSGRLVKPTQQRPGHSGESQEYFNQDQGIIFANRQEQMPDFNRLELGPMNGRQGWAREFQHNQEFTPLAVEDHQEFNQIFHQQRNDHYDGWSQSFQNHEQENQQQFQPYFNQPNNLRMVYNRGFARQETEGWNQGMDLRQDIKLNELDWGREFQRNAEENKMDSREIINSNDDALAKTAGVLADVMSTNPKFQNSTHSSLNLGNFLKMMEQFKSKEIAIEGDKVVQQIVPAAAAFDDGLSSHKMAKEFLNQNELISNHQEGSWEEQFDLAPPRNWASQYQDQNAIHNIRPEIDKEYLISQSDVSHDMDLTGGFQNRLNRSEESQKEQDRYSSVGTSELISEQELQWKAMERAYEKENPIEQESFDPRISAYQFFANNPFVNLPLTALTSAECNSSLTESILALEATVQKEPENASAWYNLGIRQQENENEFASIAALRTALSLNPAHLESYQAISISYTNENLTNLAQTALEDWLEFHPKYKTTAMPGSRTSSAVHEHLISDYLQAAMSGGQDLDADVQSALGVLFNINNDYPKAVDCFQTALAARPTDFQLWNRLGATLANSGESERAMEAYFNALQINPLYIRARYNLAIACMQIGQYQVLFLVTDF